MHFPSFHILAPYEMSPEAHQVMLKKAGEDMARIAQQGKNFSKSSFDVRDWGLIWN